MAHRRTPRGISERGFAALSPHLTLSVMALLAAAPLLLIASLVPPAATLPAISLAAITVAGVAAGVAWWRKANRHGASVTLWDVAGAFVLIGCAAAMMTDPENLMQVLGQTERR